MAPVLVERGYCLPADIAFADEDELRSLTSASSLKKPEQRRWERSVAAIRQWVSENKTGAGGEDSSTVSVARGSADRLAVEALSTSRSHFGEQGGVGERKVLRGGQGAEESKAEPFIRSTLDDDGAQRGSSFSPVAKLAESAHDLQVDLGTMGSHVMRLESKIIEQKRLKAKLESARIEAQARLGNTRRELAITQYNVSELESDERDVRKIIGEDELREHEAEKGQRRRGDMEQVVEEGGGEGRGMGVSLLIRCARVCSYYQNSPNENQWSRR